MTAGIRGSGSAVLLNARTSGALIAGALEPAYDIAGDAFDYAVNGADLHFAIREAGGATRERAHRGH